MRFELFQILILSIKLDSFLFQDHDKTIDRDINVSSYINNLYEKLLNLVIVDFTGASNFETI